MAGKFVDVTLRLVDKMTSPLNRAGQALSRHATQFKRAGKDIQKAGNSISNVGSSLTKSVTVPIVGIGSVAVKTAANFESAMSQVAATMGTTTDKISDLSELAKKMGRDTSFSAVQAADGINILAQAGLNASQITDALGTTLDLAAAGSISLDSAAQYVTATVAGFEDKMKNASTYSDLIAKGATLAKTDVSALGTALGDVSATANQYNQTANSTTISLLRLAQANITGSEAAVGLSAAMTRVYAPTDKAQKALSQLGVSVYDSKGNAKDFNKVVGELSKAMAGMSQEQANAYKKTIFGTNRLGIFNAMCAVSEKQVSKFSKELSESGNAAHDMAETQLNNLNGQIIRLKSALEAAAIAVGERLLPYIKAATEWVKYAVDKFNALSTAQLDMIVKVGAVAAAIGPCILIFGKMVLGVGKVVSVIGKVAGAFKTFGTVSAMLASPAGVVIAVLAAIALAAVVVYKNWNKIKAVIVQVVQSLQPAIKIFKEMLNTCKKTLAPIGALFKNSFGNAIKESTGIASKELGSASDIIKLFGQACTNIMSAVAPVVKKVIENIAEVLKKIIPIIAKQIPKAVSIVSKIVKSAIEIIKAIIPVVKTILATIVRVMPIVEKTIFRAFNAVLPIVKAALKLLGKVGSVIVSIVGKAIKSTMPVIQKLGACFEAVFPVIASMVFGAVNIVIAAVKMISTVFSAVAAVVGPLISGIGSIVSDVFNGIASTIGGVLDFVTGVFTGNWKKAWEGVRDIFAGIFQSFAGLVKTPMNAVISLINKAISGINGISVDIPEGIPGVGGKHIGFDIPTIPALAKGTQNWKGGIVQVSEKGGEIIDLPKGSRVYPHDKSVQKAYNDGARAGGGNIKIIIPKLADSIIVREEADIDRIITKLADKLEKVSKNLGGGELEYIY